MSCTSYHKSHTGDVVNQDNQMSCASNHKSHNVVHLRHVSIHSSLLHLKYIILLTLCIYVFVCLLYQEPNPKKKKLEHMLVGVSAREGILRIDAKTNEISDKYALKFVHHYSCTPEAFKLYYGETAEEVMVVQTSEGDAISRLLEGYAHLIIKETANDRSRTGSAASSAST
eukprot:Opistho-2@61751